MDTLDKMFIDWQTNLMPNQNSSSLSNIKSETIMQALITFEKKEKQKKESIKMICIFLALFLTFILSIYALMNFFNATTISYNLSSMYIGSILMIIAVTYTFYSFKIFDYSNESNIPTLEFIESTKRNLKSRQTKAIFTSGILILLYSLGISLVLSGIFHAFFHYFFLGFAVFLLIVSIATWISDQKEYRRLMTNIEGLETELKGQ